MIHTDCLARVGHNTIMAPGFTAENLLYLLTVHEEGSESAAAVRLGVGQATVSRKLRALRDASDTELTVRTAQGMRLTPAGARLLPHARQIRSSVQAARREITLHNDAVLEIRVGLSPHLVPRFSSVLSSAFTAPDTRATYVEANSATLVEDLRNNRLTIALTLSHANFLEIGYESRQIGDETIVIIGQPHHPVFRAATREKALMESPLFFPPEASTISRAAAAHFASLGHDEALITYTSSPAAVRAAALSGAGLGVSVRSFARTETTAGWLAELPLSDTLTVPMFFLLSDQLRGTDKATIEQRVLGLL